MVVVSEFESGRHFGTTFFLLISMVIEIISDGTDNNNKAAGVLDPGNQPEDSKEHV